MWAVGDLSSKQVQTLAWDVMVQGARGLEQLAAAGAYFFATVGWWG